MSEQPEDYKEKGMQFNNVRLYSRLTFKALFYSYVHSLILLLHVHFNTFLLIQLNSTRLILLYCRLRKESEYIVYVNSCYYSLILLLLYSFNLFLLILLYSTLASIDLFYTYVYILIVLLHFYRLILLLHEQPYSVLTDIALQVNFPLDCIVHFILIYILILLLHLYLYWLKSRPAEGS